MRCRHSTARLPNIHNDNTTPESNTIIVVRSLLRAGVQPTLDWDLYVGPVHHLRERGGIGRCVRCMPSACLCVCLSFRMHHKHLQISGIFLCMLVSAELQVVGIFPMDKYSIQLQNLGLLYYMIYSFIMPCYSRTHNIAIHDKSVHHTKNTILYTIKSKKKR